VKWTWEPVKAKIALSAYLFVSPKWLKSNKSVLESGSIFEYLHPELTKKGAFMTKPAIISLLICFSSTTWAQTACAEAFQNRPAFDNQMTLQNEFLKNVGQFKKVTGKLLWKIEGNEARVVFNENFKSELKGLIENQDQVLLQHMHKTKSRKEYRISEMQKNIAPELATLEYRLNEQAERSNQLQLDLSPVKSSQYEGLVVYGVRMAYVRNGRALPANSFQHGATYEKGRLKNNTESGTTATAAAFSGVIKSVEANQISGRIALKITIEDAQGKEFSMSSFDSLTNGEILLLKAYNPSW
jgi:hypothetical protein